LDPSPVGEVGGTGPGIRLCVTRWITPTMLAPPAPIPDLPMPPKKSAKTVKKLSPAAQALMLPPPTAEEEPASVPTAVAAAVTNGKKNGKGKEPEKQQQQPAKSKKQSTLSAVVFTDKIQLLSLHESEDPQTSFLAMLPKNHAVFAQLGAHVLLGSPLLLKLLKEACAQPPSALDTVLVRFLGYTPAPNGTPDERSRAMLQHATPKTPTSVYNTPEAHVLPATTDGNWLRFFITLAMQFFGDASEVPADAQRLILVINENKLSSKGMSVDKYYSGLPWMLHMMGFKAEDKWAEKRQLEGKQKSLATYGVKMDVPFNECQLAAARVLFAPLSRVTTH